MPHERTQARLLQVNARLYSSSREDGHPWDDRTPHKPRSGRFPYRRVPFLKMLDDTRPSIIALQECDLEDVLQRDLIPHLSATQERTPWEYEQRGKVGVAWDAGRWDVKARHEWDMPNGPGDPRRHVAVSLQSKTTDGQLWVTSCHLGVHYKGAAAVRRQQAAAMLGHLRKELGLDLARERVVLMGDINDPPTYPGAGVRTVLRKGGLTDLRTRLADDDLRGDSFDTHHGYRPTKRNGRWLDDAFTTRAVKPLSGEVVLLDPTGDYPNASDHNALFLRIEF